MPTCPRLLLVASLLAVSSCALAQQFAFLPVAGSPKDTKALFQDSQGRLWIAGDELACFDGSRFFFLRDFGFPASTALQVAEDDRGAIWIASESGVYRFSEGRVQEIAKGVAVSIVVGKAGTVVAAMGPAGKGTPADADLVRLQLRAGKWTAEAITNLESPGPLTLDSNGTILYPWTITGWGEIRFDDIVRWQPGRALPIKHLGTRGDPLNGNWKIMRDRSGCLWGAAAQRVYYDCGDGRHEPIFEGGDLEADMHEAADGSMVLWGGNILAVGRPGRFRVATRANGLPGLQNAFQAKDGTIWLSTGSGLYRFASPFQLEYWTIREGLPNPAWSVARAGGHIYAGLNRRIAVLSEDRMRWNDLARFPDGGLISGLLGNADGSLYASFIEGGGALVGNDGSVIARTEKGRPRSGSMRWGSASNGEVWLAGNALGEVTRSGSVLQFMEHPLQHSPPGNVLAVKFEERTGRLWSCYNGGLLLRDQHGNWKEFSTSDGLKTDGCWSLAPLPNGDVWYAYYNVHAFARIHPTPDGGIAVRDYQSPAVPDASATTFDADRSGRLWRTGELGVYVAGPAQAEAGAWLKLDQSDGLPANDMNSGSVFADSDGSMWWGADNDLAHYTPRSDLVTPEFAPQLFVSAFSWDDRPPMLADAAGSLPDGAKVVVHIGSLQFDRRNALRIRYRVLPDRREWRETVSLDLALGRIPSGNHTIEVQGRLLTGPWSPPVTRTFTILRPVWLAWPFLTAYVLVIPATAASGYLLHRRRKEEQKQLLPDLERWRLKALLPDAQPGTILDERFEIGNLLARGGFANVMDGYDTERRQRCAIKVFRSEVTDLKDDAWIAHRFEQEIAALERIRHPHVVAIYAHGTTPACVPYLVMEFLEGCNLREILETELLPPKRIACFLRQLAAALDAIHSQAICHRDVKPENIIIRRPGSPDEAVVLIDFSIAIVKNGNETLHGVSRAAGTFDYMAPEQAMGYAEPSSDIFSLAKVVIEMLAGRKLVDLLPEPSIDLPHRIPKLLAALPLNLSHEAVEMLSMALSFDPALRPRSASSFAVPLLIDLDG